MKIFIVDNPKVGWKRIGNLLERVLNIELAGSDADNDEIINDIKGLKPDILIFDIDMPAKKGLTLLRQISKGHTFLAIIVLTNESSSFFRKQCIEAGATFFYDKATEFHKVQQAVEILQKDFKHASN